MRIHSKPIQEHEDVPLADEGELEALTAQWASRHTTAERDAERVVGAPNRAYVVVVGDWPDTVTRDAQRREIVALTEAQGDSLVAYETLRRATADPRTFVGRGAARSIAQRARDLGANMLVIDAELTPSQARNLEDEAGMAVCDREAVILNVFLKHARSKKAKIQVEIAHLEYLRPRIRGLGLDMDQQAGGLMNARGPGETASELLARRLDGRLAELRKQFSRIVQAGATQRQSRSRCARAVLVGYTNAGKTSLMNALTGAELSARDVPFETLDTTSRCLTRHGGDVVLSDTVGFIRRLPQRLVASFESTLAEIHEASLIVVVIDASDPEWEMHVTTTEAQIAKLGAGALPRLYVFNKMDQADATPSLWRAAVDGQPFVAVSAHEPETVADLRSHLIAVARRDDVRKTLFVPYEASGISSQVYARCRVLEAEAFERGQRLTVEGPRRVLDDVRAQLRRMR